MVGPLGIAAAALVMVGRDVDLAADDGLDAAGGRFVMKIHSPKEIPMVGDGHRGHAQRCNLFDEIRDFADPIQQTVFRVGMQVNELRTRVRSVFLSTPAFALAPQEERATPRLEIQRLVARSPIPGRIRPKSSRSQRPNHHHGFERDYSAGRRGQRVALR